jgi:hypothetical protein
LGEVRRSGKIGFDDEEGSAPVLGLERWHPDGGDEPAAGPHQRSRAVEDLAADHVEHHVNLAGEGAQERRQEGDCDGRLGLPIK